MFRYVSAVLLVSVLGCQAAKILGVFPTPSISHQVVYRALFYNLAARGHEVVLVTPNPGLPKDRVKDNITEIDVNFVYTETSKMITRIEKKRGIVIDMDVIIQEIETIFTKPAEMTLNHPEVRALFEDGNTKFDLIMSESLFFSPIVLSKLFDAPLILFSSLYGLNENYEMFGAPARHPLLYPNFYRERINNLSSFEKITAIYDELRLWHAFSNVADKETELAKTITGDFAMTLEDLKDNVDLLFLNIHSMFDGNRPVPPNVVYLGGLHLKPVKKLPEDLQAFLDNSQNGVVYVSLGTNVRTDHLEPALLDAFLEAFETLPYDVLWKFDGDSLPRKIKNLRTQKWFPQRDLLPHPKIKAFVTQGGLQSMDEAIDAGVPLVTIPALGDQWYNAERFEQFGIGIKLDFLKLEASHIVDAVHKVIDDKSYRANMRRVKTILEDQPESPMERAVWWTEYVIRNKGAKHLRATSFNMSWSDYLMLDVVLVVLGAAVTALIVAYLALKQILRLICKSRQSKKTKLKKK